VSPSRAARAGAGLFVGLATALVARVGLGDPAPAGALIDRAVVRFYAPETGGALPPRFVGERTLAFEARLMAMAERSDGLGEGYQERHVREALEHHVAEAMLASLARKLVAGEVPYKRPTDAELTGVRQDLGAASVERLGGRERVYAAASAEHLDASEVDVILERQAMAAWYLDRAVLPILRPTDEQLREVLRTSANPFSGQSFDQVRVMLQRWYVIERLRAAESAFLQAARSRVVVVITR
jgi:hypothetical protein